MKQLFHLSILVFMISFFGFSLAIGVNSMVSKKPRDNSLLEIKKLKRKCVEFKDTGSLEKPPQPPEQ